SPGRRALPSDPSKPSPARPPEGAEGDASGSSVESPRCQGWRHPNSDHRRGFPRRIQTYRQARRANRPWRGGRGVAVLPRADYTTGPHPASRRGARPAGSIMSEPRILKEEIGPNGNIRAVVEEDGRSVHLYLEGTTDDHPFGVRSCWIRNLRPAPALIAAEIGRASCRDR